MAPGAVRADDWGCQVMLCLSNPGGPEQYAGCVPPIERLWAALRRGDPFPVCDLAAGGSQGSSATSRSVSAGYCRGDRLHRGGPGKSEPLCNARGAIHAVRDGAPYTRVWSNVPGTARTRTGFVRAFDLAFDHPRSMPLPPLPDDPTRGWLQREMSRSARSGGEDGTPGTGRTGSTGGDGKGGGQ
ncbi:MAG TPA: hypothetical protein VJS30_27760 [Paraburkholderia sp.]|nr:hypothetical protein [Paraburkholderia sp.]